MQIETKIMEQVKNVLRQFGTKYIAESGTLKQSTVISDLDKYDHDLMMFGRKSRDFSYGMDRPL